MVGRNFWAVKQDGGWIVREEGLPDQTTPHPSEEDAWATAKERAAELHGEAFLQDENGEICARENFRQMPRDFSRFSPLSSLRAKRGNAVPWIAASLRSWQ